MRPHKPDGDLVGAPVTPAQTLPTLAVSFRRGALATIVLLLALLAAAILHPLLDPRDNPLSDVFLYEQDIAVLNGFVVALLVLALPWPWRLRISRPAPRPSWRLAFLIALAVTLVAWSGSYLVYDDFALSMDEFMARFDAQILASGRLAAPVPPEWREYVKALQPIFVLDIPGQAYWVSGYLPVNAAFLALGLKLGMQNLVPALWAGISIVATFGVGRRLWPGKPGTALIAVALLATSPQLLITAMTPYAMSAHLALNMVWLWLFLRGGRLGHGLAGCVAFLATGLHQLVFHPLFAAPFVVELWLARRWKPALWHTAAYAAIGAFWALYPPMLMHIYGAGAVAQAAERSGAVSTLIGLLAKFDPAGFGYIAKNLIRLVTWQNLLLIPLVLSAIVPALRAGGALRAFVLGLAATLALAFVVMPYQGHGWGYRYLHGLLGSLCLLGAWNWTRLAEAQGSAVTGRRAIFACGAAASLLLLLPLRAIQAHAFEHPYAAAVRQIEAMDADVVLVDADPVWYGKDLIRNDPFLARRPRVLWWSSLSSGQAAELCRTSSVRWFDSAEAHRLGLRRTAGRVGTPPDCAIERGQSSRGDRSAP